MQITYKPVTDLVEGDLIDLEDVQEILTELRKSGQAVKLLGDTTMHVAETEFAAVESVELNGNDDTVLISTDQSAFALPASNVNLRIHGNMSDAEPREESDGRVTLSRELAERVLTALNIGAEALIEASERQEELLEGLGGSQDPLDVQMHDHDVRIVEEAYRELYDLTH